MILVDPIRSVRPTKDYRYVTACHMASDASVEELISVAVRIGLTPEWLQDEHKRPHFDMTALRRQQLIMRMMDLTFTPIEQVTTRELLRRMYRPGKDVQ